jgi:hypothetical protein
MKHLQSFSLFEAQTSVLTTDQEAFLNEYIKGAWSVNPTTGLVDVEGNFACSSKRLKSLSGISFGHVSGNFACFNNQLTSLKGAPQTVGGGFDCSYNDLTSLEGAPQTVGGDFNCFYNYNLKSLEGAPRTVGVNFDCSYNDLTSLEGAPQTVGGDFNCFYNYNLKSLEGAPRTVGVNFLSDKFQLEEGEWNMQGWLEVLNTGTEEAKKLISTLPWLQPDWWNLELQRDPGKTVHLLGSLWKHMPKDMQSAIKIPGGYEDDFELFSGFNELGLF